MGRALKGQFFRYSIYDPSSNEEVASFDDIREAKGYIDRFLNSDYEIEDIESGTVYFKDNGTWENC